MPEGIVTIMVQPGDLTRRFFLDPDRGFKNIWWIMEQMRAEALGLCG